ncbi:MAG TPA: hypothetical protein VFJ96_01135, partial [Gemmatimonadaceae bacterium]|nr:hypothetical protein [Gemmatimonadaceae bacterium]
MTRSESDLPGAYVLEAIDNHLLPVQVGGLARNPVSTCRITGGTLTLDATGRFTLRDALGDCPSTTYISLAGMYAGGLVPDPNENVSQTGTYTSTDKSLALHFDDSFLQG